MKQTKWTKTENTHYELLFEKNGCRAYALTYGTYKDAVNAAKEYVSWHGKQEGLVIATVKEVTQYADGNFFRKETTVQVVQNVSALTWFVADGKEVIK